MAGKGGKLVIKGGTAAVRKPGAKGAAKGASKMMAGKSCGKK